MLGNNGSNGGELKRRYGKNFEHLLSWVHFEYLSGLASSKIHLVRFHS